MSIDALLPTARTRLVTLTDDAPLIRAAQLLRSGTDILAICGIDGRLLGVITKTDVVNQISQCQGHSCAMPAISAMKHEVIVCRYGDSLPDLWTRMKELGLKNVPYVDQDQRPVGIINARDLLQQLLKESTDQESMMRDYVMGIGYR